jgi:hypothetical protein
MRTALLLVPMFSFAACGTVCDQAVAAEQGAKSKSNACNVNVTIHDANKCDNNLTKCSADDMTQIQNYAKCLNDLPVCDPNTNGSHWGLDEALCGQPLLKLSLNCSTSIQ